MWSRKIQRDLKCRHCRSYFIFGKSWTPAQCRLCGEGTRSWPDYHKIWVNHIFQGHNCGKILERKDREIKKYLQGQWWGCGRQGNKNAWMGTRVSENGGLSWYIDSKMLPYSINSQKVSHVMAVLHPRELICNNVLRVWVCVCVCMCVWERKRVCLRERESVKSVSHMHLADIIDPQCGTNAYIFIARGRPRRARQKWCNTRVTHALMKVWDQAFIRPRGLERRFCALNPA